jgi:dihydroorotate dehydrogenase
MLYRSLRKLLFLIDAERVHHLVMALFGALLALGPLRRLVAARMRPRDPRLAQELWGIRFEGPVGLAAGFDKNAAAFNQLGALGFGFIEVGTVTALAQPGNARPRLFRLSEDEALLNRMGFNNDGAAAVAARLAASRIEPVLGVNLGKSKVTALEDAVGDYVTSLRALYPFARYVVVNVSSPNTPGLRALQERGPLLALLVALREEGEALRAKHGGPGRPLLLKIAPDVSDALLEDILSVVEEARVDGIIATNTTIAREGLKSVDAQDLGTGGISGAPVRARALEVVRMIHARTGGRIPIIGVGGVFSGEDALALILAGASLVQVWTGFVYEGPGMVRKIHASLAEACSARGVSSITELIGRG